MSDPPPSAAGRKDVRAWLVAGVALAVVCLLFVGPLTEFKPDRVSWRNYERINQGMTLAEVEALVGGPGQEIHSVPTYPGYKPVVTGDRFFRWEGDVNSRRVIVGLRDGRVCDKWFREDSL